MKRSLFQKSLALFGATTVVGAAVPLALSGPTQSGAATGILMAALASATALVLLALAFDRGFNVLLGALVVGFLLRMMLVAAGVLVTLALGGEPLAFTAAFFALYLAHQVIELAVVVRHAPKAAEGKA